MPEIYMLLKLKGDDGTILVVECQQQLAKKLKSVAIGSTMVCAGIEVVATASPIIMPIGEQIKDGDEVTGEELTDWEATKREGYPIHRKPPSYEDLSTEKEVLYTGIKVIDLIEPYS
jgi:F-type H+-transporting ATPase subunit beta